MGRRGPENKVLGNAHTIMLAQLFICDQVGFGGLEFDLLLGLEAFVF